MDVRFAPSRAFAVFLLGIALTACGGSGRSISGDESGPGSDPSPGTPPAEGDDVFLSVVPPGQNGNSFGGGAQGILLPPNFTDQLFLYEELAFSPENLKAEPCDPPANADQHAAADRSQACSHFKPGGLEPAEVTDTATVTNPETGNQVTIRRDGWGVPFVEGPTRADGMFGVGYATAQDRLFLFDVLRNIGRGRLSQFLGPEDSFFEFDKDIAVTAAFSEAELTRIVEETAEKFGTLGDLVLNDVNNLVAGINTYVDTMALAEIPLEYLSLVVSPTNPGSIASFPPEDFTVEDVVASAILIQSIFAFGGGGEAANLNLLQAYDPGLSSSNKNPSTQACDIWRDFRHANDPDTPQTDPLNVANASQSPATIPEDCTAAWPAGHGSLPAGTAVWDPGSFQGRDIFVVAGSALPLDLDDVLDGLPLPLQGTGLSDSATQPFVGLGRERLRSILGEVRTFMADRGKKLQQLGRTEAGRELIAKYGEATRRSYRASENPHASAQETLAAAGFPVPTNMSNFIGVTADQTKSGHPIAVMGPQTSYFLPQLLVEVAVKTGGDNPGPLDFAGRGVIFGNLPYINIGRGIDFAWSATSGNSDLVDTRVSKMCLLPDSPLAEPLSGQPSREDNFNNATGAAGADGFPDADGYLFDADPSDGFDPECRPLFFRTDEWTANPTVASVASGGPFQPQQVQRFVMRTHYGPVFATATVDGEPVVVSSQRSTYFAELDTAPPFALASTYSIDSAERFFEVFNGVTGTFNWQYVDDEDLAWIHSGLYPNRPPEHHPELPVWGDGRFDWEGAQVDLSEDPDFFSRVRNSDASYNNLATPEVRGDPLRGFFEYPGFRQLEDHPRVINPPEGFQSSWNNNPTTGWWASDSNGSYGPTHRADLLDDRLRAFQAAGRKHDIGTMVEIMSDAAHADLRGQRVLPKALEIMRTASAAQIESLGLAEIPDQAAFQQVADFLEAWVLDGSMDWIDPENPERGLGGYRRDRNIAHAARNDGDEALGQDELALRYDYRAQVVLSDAWYEELIEHTLPQVAEQPAGASALQGRLNAPGPMGSAFQNGWFQFMERVFGQALDNELGGNRVAGDYKALRCGGANAAFADCREALFRSLNDALVRLEGFDNRDTWSGGRLYGQPVEAQDAIRHTAISAQAVEAMHWSNRPTYQQVVEIFNDRSAQ